MICAGLIAVSALFHVVAQTTLHTSGKQEIVLDAGHGGLDPGAVSADGISEKDINLDIVLILRDLLTASGFSVTLTRETDCSLHEEGCRTVAQKKTSDLKKRLSIAHNARARSKESKIKKEALVMDVDSKAVLDDALRLGCDAVIHGHTHRPGTYRLNDTINRYVLADWDFRASNAYRGGYLTIVDQQIETHSFC